MEYAARLPRSPSRRTLVAPLVALLVGAGVATGAYALIDDNDVATQASKVIVVEQPAPGTADIPGKNESSTAAAISQSGGIELRGSKASATSKQAFDADSAQSAAAEQRSDPHGPAVALRSH
jgi:hypothetical protein